MIIDSSALLSILRTEPDAAQFAYALDESISNRVSVVSFVEVAMIIDRDGNPIAKRRFAELLEEASIEIEPVTPKQGEIARVAWTDFGKGSGHRAQLNFGDLFSYALAIDKREPLLFKGGDFDKTDVRSAL